MSRVYRRYNYSIFGAEKVGKTNIITRFTKDEFTEAHNLTLEGKQTATMEKDGKVFEVNLYDTAGQENMVSMKAVWRNGKNGFLFTFALNNADSLASALKEIEEVQEEAIFQETAIILVGNKSDLEYERKVTKKQAQAEAAKFGIKYFEVSAKTSSKEEIDRLISELIDMNEMQHFYACPSDSQKTNTTSSTVLKFFGNKCESLQDCSCSTF